MSKISDLKEARIIQKEEKALEQRKHPVRKALGIIASVVIIPICIVALVLVAKAIMYPDIPPSVFGYTPLVVQSGSMEDTIHTGDLIFVKNSEDNAVYGVGDIICFSSTTLNGESNVYVTHRITSIAQDENGKSIFTTKGDANNAVDEGTITSDNILGIYYGFHISGLGDFLIYLQTVQGMLLCVVLPIVLLIAIFTIIGRYDELIARTDRLLAEREKEE